MAWLSTQSTGYKLSQHGSTMTISTTSLKTLLAVLCWMTLNISCNFFNRILFFHLGWHFPILLTLSHGVTCVFYYTLCTKSGLADFESISLNYFLRFIVPSGLFLCSTIVLNNIGLDFIDVASTQIIKSLTPMFTAFFSIFFLNQREPLIVYPIFFICSLGVALSTEQTGTNVSSLGVVLVTASALCLSMATTLQQLILTRISDAKRLHPMSLVFYTTPVEMCLLMPLFLIFELPNYAERNQTTQSPRFLVFLIFLDATCVFLLRWVQNITIKSTSALTVTVISQVKFVIVIAISSVFFGYSLTLKKFIGLCLLVIGTSSYGILRLRRNNSSSAPRNSSSSATPRPFTNKILIL
eukprot:TRINITY_DN923_c0_g1_i1.p1 TRINITY_DN923_c0_g1~~TRINITY_DN923_c0_g1_i1.p1  ORF type:complete len:354 (-),score=24.18 TRINITY_DN923_c0_g1_i1:36-1097(-)